MENKQKNNKKPFNLGTWTNKNNQPYAKNGISFSISHRAAPGSEEVISVFYTNRAPKLKIKGQEIDVEYSSTEQDNQTLLHFLAGKV